MSRDADAKISRLFDKRTLDRNIKKGLITRKDYDKHIKTLEDVAGKGVHGGDEDDAGGRDDAPSPGGE